MCVDDSQHTLARAVRYLYRFHVYTAMAMKTEHTDATLMDLARYADGLLTCLKDSPLFEERPSHYLFVKAHLLFLEKVLQVDLHSNYYLELYGCQLMIISRVSMVLV